MTIKKNIKKSLLIALFLFPLGTSTQLRTESPVH